MRESSRHRVAFNVYWYLGPKRSLEAVAETIAARPSDFGFKRAPHPRTLYRWSARFHWQDRLAEMETEARKLQLTEQVDELRQMNERHVKEALALQQRGIARLQTFGDRDLSPEEARRAIVEGIKIERLVRGEPTERSDITGGITVGQIDLSRFSDSELERFIRTETQGEG